MAKSVKKGFLNVLSWTRELVLTCNFLTMLYLRSFHIIYFTLGIIATVIIAKILKKIIRQPRPMRYQGEKIKKSYGMPSSHSSAICFMTTYSQCLFTAALTWQNVIVLLLFHGFALAVVWSRVRLGHHTKSQVICGSLLGFSCALVAFNLWKSYFSTLDLDDRIDEIFSYLFNLRKI